MKKLNLIKVFKFKQAEYDVADAFGNEFVLKLDYKNNKFSIEVGIVPNSTKAVAANFENELIEVAQDLLTRKHGVNFADTGQL